MARPRPFPSYRSLLSDSASFFRTEQPRPCHPLTPWSAARRFSSPQGGVGGRGEGGGGDDDDDDDGEISFSGWSEEDDDEMSSPLDDVDPWVFFADTMSALGQQDPARAAVFLGGLDFKGQALAMGLQQFAQQRREEAAAEKAKEAAEEAAAAAAAAGAAAQ